MLRDHAKAMRNRENGRRGGNPGLKPGVNPEVKAQIPEARYQKYQKSESRVSISITMTTLMLIAL
jgi:hypothetical protein